MLIKSITELISIDSFYSRLYTVRKLANEHAFNDNAGGMDIIAGAWLLSILDLINPICFVESGVWRGFSSLLFDEYSRNKLKKKHFLFDPLFKDSNFQNSVLYSSSSLLKFSEDINSSKFSNLPRGSTYFFDDHQDQLERLVMASLRSAHFIIFDDNYFFGGGAHRSLFDHLKNPQIESLLSCIVDTIWVVPPIKLNNLGFNPIYNSLPFSIKQEFSDFFDHEKYNWLTVVKMKENNSCLKSQGEIVF